MYTLHCYKTIVTGFLEYHLFDVNELYLGCAPIFERLSEVNKCKGNRLLLVPSNSF